MQEFLFHVVFKHFIVQFEWFNVSSWHQMFQNESSLPIKWWPLSPLITHQENKNNNYGCDYNSSSFVPVRSCRCCHIHNFDFWYKEKLKRSIQKDAYCDKRGISKKGCIFWKIFSVLIFNVKNKFSSIPTFSISK